MSQSICSSCEKEITSAEIIISSTVKLCQDCSNCSICNKQVTIDQIRLCLSHNNPIRHDSCARVLNQHSPNVPRQRCCHLDERGQQCDSWFPAVDKSKLCPLHSQSVRTNGRVENTPLYIDLVNDERSYCYHFLDGTEQKQEKTLIFEFKDDESGTVFDKLDSHIAFLEKVIEDVKARLHEARAVKSEKLDELTEDQREERRKVKIDKAFKPSATKTASFKSDPIAHLTKKQGMSASDANDLLNMDMDALLAKFEASKKLKENKL